MEDTCHKGWWNTIREHGQMFNPQKQTTELQRPREVHNCQLQASVRKKPAHGALGWTSEGRRTHTWRRTLTNGCVFRGCTETGNGTTDKNGHILSLPKSRLIFMSPSNIEGKNSWKRKFNFVHLRGGRIRNEWNSVLYM